MKIDYDVGDVVVYIGGPNRIPEGHPLCIGKMYKVEMIISPSPGIYGTIICGYRSGHPTGAWCITAFRKLPKADDYFTEYMRSMKPHKQPVDA